MKRCKYVLFVVLILLLAFTSQVFANTEKVVMVFDNSSNTLDLTTSEKGEIVYAYKYSGGVVEDIDGTLLSDGEDTAKWAVYGLDKKEEELRFSDDKNTWLVYDKETFNTSNLVTGDKFIFLYTCVRYKDNTFSDTQYYKIEINTTTPVITANVVYGEEKATINISVSSDAGVKTIENSNTGEVVKNSSTAQFKVTKNNTYIIYTEDNNGNYESTVVSVNKIKSVNTEDDLVENVDSTNPTMELKGVTTKKQTTPMLITVTATDDNSGVKYILLPNGKKEYVDTVEYVIEENGEYIFKAVDNYENVVEKKLNVKNISKVNSDKSNNEDLDDFNSDGTGRSFGTLPQTGGFSIEMVTAILLSVVLIGMIFVLLDKSSKKKKVK